VKKADKCPLSYYLCENNGNCKSCKIAAANGVPQEPKINKEATS